MQNSSLLSYFLSRFAQRLRFHLEKWGEEPLKTKIYNKDK